MGSLFGSLLTELGWNVTLYDVWREHVEVMNEEGCASAGPTGPSGRSRSGRFPRRHSSRPQPGRSLREMYADTVGETSRTHAPSMLQDIEAGRRTETDVLNGSVVEFAEEHGIVVPIDRTLARLAPRTGTEGLNADRETDRS